MASTSETGYAQNAANFGTLISSITGYGTKYNPSKDSIKLPNLQIVKTKADDVLKEEHTAFTVNSTAIADRQVAYSPINKLVTRSLNNLKSTDASDQIINTAKSIANDIRGGRATPKPTEPGAQVNSSSQVGFEDKASNFDKYIKLLQGIPLYAPNEADLKVTALVIVYDKLKPNNDAVVESETALNNVRIERDRIFDAPDTGLVDVALDAKTYIKSIYGSNSPEYKQISKLKFVRVKE